MKLPFDFGLKLLFRLVIPGFFLSLGTSPLLFFLLDLGGWGFGHDYVFVIAVFLLGWMIIIADMEIYMLFEGRRYWYPAIHERFVVREQKRLCRLQEKAALSKLEEVYMERGELSALNDEAMKRKLRPAIERHASEYLEAWFDLRGFPVNEKSEYYVTSPSRLGNLITAFEGYSGRVYGMDAVFYWPQLWLKLDKDTREELANQQALADSTIYSSFALFLSGLLWLMYASSSAINWVVLRFAPRLSIGRFERTLFDYVPNPFLSCLLSLIFVALGYLVYRVSLGLHAQFGETFKAVFDVFEKNIDVSEHITKLEKNTGGLVSSIFAREEQLSSVYRHLRFGLVKCSKCGRPMPSSDAKFHPCSKE